MKKKNVGSSFDEWLREEGIYGESTSRALKRVLARQLEAAMKDQNVSKAEMAKRMRTSRAALDRLLDPGNDAVTLTTLQKAARRWAVRSDWSWFKAGAPPPETAGTPFPDSSTFRIALIRRLAHGGSEPPLRSRSAPQFTCGRSGRGSSPWPTSSQSPARTSLVRRTTHRLPPPCVTRSSTRTTSR